MIEGITFENQLFTSGDFAAFINAFLAGTEGVLNGCTMSESGGNIYLQAGRFVTRGRLTKITGVETIPTPNVSQESIFCMLVYEIDLTRVNTETEFNQGIFKILTNAATYPNPMQEDILATGTLYQQPWATFRKTITGAVEDFRDVRTNANVSDINNKILDTLEEIDANTSAGMITGAIASKELNGKLGGLRFYEENGNKYVVGADSVPKKLGDPSDAVWDDSHVDTGTYATGWNIAQTFNIAPCNLALVTVAASGSGGGVNINFSTGDGIESFKNVYAFRYGNDTASTSLAMYLVKNVSFLTTLYVTATTGSGNPYKSLIANIMYLA